MFCLRAWDTILYTMLWSWYLAVVKDLQSDKNFQKCAPVHTHVCSVVAFSTAFYQLSSAAAVHNKAVYSMQLSNAAVVCNKAL